MGLFLFLHIPLALYPRSVQRIKIDLTDPPMVTIVIPTFHPNVLALESNFKKIHNVNYKNYEIIVVDNSTDLKLVEKIESLTKMHKIRFFHRDSLLGFKSANINYILDHVKGKYILFIDIDQIIIPESIEKFVEILEANNNLAFVQAKYDIKNDNSIVRIAIAIMYAYYYEVLSLGKDFKNRVLFNGTTACFRKSAISAVNGFPEETYCEDIDISTILLLAGYKSSFLDDYATTALVPWKLKDLISSMWRWAHGATSIAKIRFRKNFSSSKLNFLTKIELFMNNLVWISGSGIVVISSCLTYIMVLFFSLSTFLGSLLAVISSKKIKWLLDLPVYFIASLSLFFFIFPAVVNALFNKNSPKDENSQWNRDLNLILYGIFMIPYGVINSILAFDAFMKNDLIWVFFVFIAVSMISPFFFLFKDKYIDTKKLEREYFEQISFEN
jgi:cellulose synthase/poly-beta-1,6-N-acetylglucosamine synthase-like glycosyltransferase